MSPERETSVSDSLHVFEQNFLSAAVIEFRGLAVGVSGEHSCTFDRSPNSMIPPHRR
jgi:hypothetical protein